MLGRNNERYLYVRKLSVDSWSHGYVHIPPKIIIKLNQDVGCVWSKWKLNTVTKPRKTMATPEKVREVGAHLSDFQKQYLDGTL